MALDTFARMAAASAITPARWRRPFLTWLDGIEAGWAIPALIVGFAGVWWLFLVVAYQSGDLHGDALETWTLGRTFEWGNAKHPPLMGWVARLWTVLFPLTDWSFQLLSMTNAAVALWAVDLVARRFVRGEARAVVLLLLMLTPVYQFYAQRFNANTVLLAIWPLATYGFLRSFETRAITWSIAAGGLAALAMLGKYYSVFLIASFAFAAIVHPQRAAYFKSWAPWCSALTGLVVLAPHLHWLAVTGAMPFSYAIEAHGGFGFYYALHEAEMFVLGIAAALAIPAVAWVLSAGMRLKRFPADVSNMAPSLVLLFWIFVGTIVFPVLTALAIGSDMPSLWAAQGLFLPAVLIVAGASYTLERFYVVNLAVLVAGIAIVAVVVAAPIHAIIRNSISPNERTYYHLAADEVTQRWHQATSQPMPLVSGDDGLAFATAFYGADHPYYSRPFRYQYTWKMPRVTTLEKGWTGICFAADRACTGWMDQVEAMEQQSIRITFDVHPELWGRPGRPATIAALMVLPQETANEAPPVPPEQAPDEFGARHR